MKLKDITHTSADRYTHTRTYTYLQKENEQLINYGGSGGSVKAARLAKASYRFCFCMSLYSCPHTSIYFLACLPACLPVYITYMHTTYIDRAGGVCGAYLFM